MKDRGTMSKNVGSHFIFFISMYNCIGSMSLINFVERRM